MYDWRIFCNQTVKNYVSEKGLVTEPSDYGHLEHFHYGGEKVCEEIHWSLDLKASDVLLDAGCGIGGSARTLSKRNLSVVGIDANAEFIRYAKSLSRPSPGAFHNPRYKHERLEDLREEKYDAWFALLVFVHIENRVSLFQKLEHDCSVNGRYFIEAIVSNSDIGLFEHAIWKEAELEALMPLAQVSSQTERWTTWTQARLERFLQRRHLFEDLYGQPIFEKRVSLYEKVAEGFQSGRLEGRRIIGESGRASGEIETDLGKTCIIELDQFLGLS